MTWSNVPFGKYQGNTLPQILLLDPDWYFWILPELYGQLAAEAKALAERATKIKIPKKWPQNWCVKYHFDDEDRFCGFDIVKASSPQHLKYSERHPYLDLSLVRGRKAYDKGGSRRLIRDFRYYYFDDLNFTKNRCEAFFDDETHFIEFG
jgi:hypothetical protein